MWMTPFLFLLTPLIEMFTNIVSVTRLIFINGVLGGSDAWEPGLVIGGHFVGADAAD